MDERGHTSASDPHGVCRNADRDTDPEAESECEDGDLDKVGDPPDGRGDERVDRVHPSLPEQQEYVELRRRSVQRYA